MVEMALVTLLLCVLTFGIADIGLYMFNFVQTANCTREAARRAAVRQDPTNIPYCPSPNLMPTVTYSAGGAPGTDVTASISRTNNWVVICYLIPGMSCTMPLTSSTTMRMEGQRI
jgi:Flp pilus assembly protein TadG